MPCVIVIVIVIVMPQRMHACVAGWLAGTLCLPALQGADAWARCSYMGRTALHLAAQHNRPDAVHALLNGPRVQAVVMLTPRRAAAAAAAAALGQGASASKDKDKDSAAPVPMLAK